MAIPNFIYAIKTRLPLPIILTVVVGLIGTGVLFNLVSHLESEKISANFQQQAIVRIAAVERGLVEAEDTLRTVNLLFETNKVVTREQFATLAHGLSSSAPYIQSLSFQRIVSSAQRAHYEDTMRQQFPNFSIMHWDNGIRSPVGEQDSYRVIDYIEPAAQNQAAFGLDTSKVVELNASAAQARDTGLVLATSRLTLPQGKLSKNGIVMFMPVYQPGASPKNVAARRLTIQGFTTMAFRMEDLVQYSLGAAKVLNKNGLDISVYAADEPTASELVFQHDADPPGIGGAIQPRFSLYPILEDVSHRIVAAGKPWHIVISPTPDTLLGNRLGSFLTLMAGVLVTLLAAANLQVFAKRTRLVEQIVDERTHQLTQANALLVRDIALRKVAEQSLLLRERALASSANAMLIAHAHPPDYPIMYVNPAFERITGYMAHEVIGTSCRFLQGDDSLQSGIEEIRAALREQREGHAVVRNYRKDGSLFWNDIHLSPVKDRHGDVTHFVAAQYDITETRRYQAELETQANYDTLTGLANRNLLNDRLGNAIAQASRYRHSVWVLVLDLDRFKLVNDSMGQQAGDIVLKAIADRLTLTAREIDTVARFGADEFVLVLPQQTNVDMRVDVLQRVMVAISEVIVIAGQELHLTSSVGVAVYPTDGDNAESLLTHAGIAMYRAKESGRNNFKFYRPAMDERAMDRLRLESELHSALARGEFLLHYQPQVDVVTGNIVGMEALIRWRHPTRGMIPPVQFISVAEETGLIVPIGAWVTHTACLQAKMWADAGLGQLRVAVNLSARQFGQKDLVAMISGVLQETGLEARYLEIELTESLIMRDVQQAILTLQQIKQLGVLLSVDDFGTGYSSLSYLKRFPIDTLKIDQAFVRDITMDADDAAIVNAIISLAHNLRLTVIAEGVETEAQLDYLRRQGCDEIQGYYFSRPIPCDAFEALLRSGVGLTNFQTLLSG